MTIHPEAQREFDGAIDYYEEVRTGLGREFRDEVMMFVDRIKDNPKRYSIRKLDVRRANLDRFPYSVNYVSEDGDVLIVAIAHHRRKPLYWLARLES
jgi:plasmid stabilization system protein ParE